MNDIVIGNDNVHLNYKWILANKKEDIPEVIEVREKIKKAFDGIFFKEDTHQYFLPEKGNIELNCVSNMTHKYVPYVDWDEVCRNKAMKLGIPFEELKEKWRYNNIKATNSGTHVHEYGESWFYYARGEKDKVIPMFKRQIEGDYFLPNSKKEEAVEAFYSWYLRQNGLYTIMPETQVYTDKYAGTFDLLAYYKHPTDDTKSGLVLLDWKTNNALHNNFARNNNSMLLPPFDHLYNEDESLYTLQLSLYQIPLEDIGFKIVGRRLIWVKEDGTYEMVRINDETKRLRQDIWGNATE